jgi:hypothetical protein
LMIENCVMRCSVPFNAEGCELQPADKTSAKNASREMIGLILRIAEILGSNVLSNFASPDAHADLPENERIYRTLRVVLAMQARTISPRMFDCADSP